MASLYAVMPAEDAWTTYRALDAAARSAKAAGDPRTMDQLRADALALMGVSAVETGWIGPSCADPPRGGAPAGCGDADLPGCPDAPGCADPPGGTDAPEDADGWSMPGCADRSALARRGPPDESEVDCECGQHGCAGLPRMRIGVIGGRSAHIRVTVPLTVLMGGADGPGADLPGANDPAELEGYGPIPASVARALAAGSTWQRLVTDPIDESVRELSTTRYEPPEAMADLVRATHPRCVRPGCGCLLRRVRPAPRDPMAARDDILEQPGPGLPT